MELTHKLLQDHYSKGKDKKLYGLRGDKVSIVDPPLGTYELPAVCLVKNSLGDTFPISTELIEKI